MCLILAIYFKIIYIYFFLKKKMFQTKDNLFHSIQYLDLY